MDLFTAISEPNRRRLLDSLLNGPQAVSALVDAVGMSQPVVSKHLRALRDAGLVSVEPDGQRRLYSINAEPLAELDAWLMPYRKFWSARIDGLERHLDTTAKQEKKWIREKR